MTLIFVGEAILLVLLLLVVIMVLLLAKGTIGNDHMLKILMGMSMRTTATASTATANNARNP